jgi:hypothetical protein
MLRAQLPFAFSAKTCGRACALNLPVAQSPNQLSAACAADGGARREFAAEAGRPREDEADDRPRQPEGREVAGQAEGVAGARTAWAPHTAGSSSRPARSGTHGRQSRQGERPAAGRFRCKPWLKSLPPWRLPGHRSTTLGHVTAGWPPRRPQPATRELDEGRRAVTLQSGDYPAARGVPRKAVRAKPSATPSVLARRRGPPKGFGRRGLGGRLLGPLPGGRGDPPSRPRPSRPRSTPDGPARADPPPPAPKTGQVLGPCGRMAENDRIAQHR